MKVKKCALITLALLFAMSPAYSQSLWVSNEEGFAAKFPSDPKKVEASSSTKSGYAYQSAKKFDTGFALYSITVAYRIPKLSDTEDLKRYIEKANSGYIKSYGKNPKEAQTSWDQFGDGRPKLKYVADIQHSGIQLRSKGYWIEYKGKILRISVTYNKTLSRRKEKSIESFLNTFIIIKE